MLLLAACTDANGDTEAPSARTDGPVQFEGGERFGSTAAVHADAGTAVVFGQTLVRNDGRKPATLTGASLGGEGTVDGGAAVSQARALDLTGDRDLVGAAVWPFEDYRERSVPLAGYTLGPGGEAELLFVVMVEETGEWYWPRTRVQYDVDGES